MTHTTEQEQIAMNADRALMVRSLNEWVMETGAVVLNSSWHSELQSIVEMAFDKGADLQAARRALAVPVPQSIEQMAVDRYKVVPSHTSVFYPCAVVAGDGQQQLYIGREAECQNMARKFTGAFLDGAFVALAAAPQPAAAALVPSIAVTPEMVEAANEAYCPFGDMELALCAALQVAPIAPGAAPVPQGWKLVPVELLDRATESLGSFVSDHGWGQADMDTFDDLSALAAAQKPPEAAPVQLPEPVAFALEWTFNGEERGMRLYDDETHCRFDAESDGGVCHPLYTDQQVRQLLAAHGIEVSP